MLLPLKQHSFKKQSNSSIKNTNTFDLCLNNVPCPKIFRRLPDVLSTGESFLNSNNSMKRWNKTKRPKDISHGTRMRRLGKKTRAKESHETVPLIKVLVSCGASYKCSSESKKQCHRMLWEKRTATRMTTRPWRPPSPWFTASSPQLRSSSSTEASPSMVALHSPLMELKFLRYTCLSIIL